MINSNLKTANLRIHSVIVGTLLSEIKEIDNVRERERNGDLLGQTSVVASCLQVQLFVTLANLGVQL